MSCLVEEFWSVVVDQIYVISLYFSVVAIWHL
jgi:hypothetical protein